MACTIFRSRGERARSTGGRMIRIHVDQERCVGAGHCVRVAASVFDQRDDDGIVVLLSHEAPDDMRTKLERAEELCPSQAIRIEIIPDS